MYAMNMELRRKDKNFKRESKKPLIDSNFAQEPKASIVHYSEAAFD
jgi:hypothetical protein